MALCSADQVFGCGLEMLCDREKSTVPRFVRLCTEAVERRGTVTVIEVTEELVGGEVFKEF